MYVTKNIVDLKLKIIVPNIVIVIQVSWYVLYRDRDQSIMIHIDNKCPSQP